ncbi:MAG: hypothetical protein WC208_09545 [Gallionella sp.]|jgi:hypothetical protein
MTPLTEDQAETAEMAEVQITAAQGALSAFMEVLKQATDFHPMPMDLYYLLRPIHGEILGALNEIQAMQGK